MNSFKELRVWKAAIDLTLSIYQLTSGFPKDELFGLSRQLRDAAISVPSNISEGFARGTRKEFLHFLSIAHGSMAEIETQLVLSNQLGFLPNERFEIISAEVSSVAKQLRALRISLQKKSEDQAPSTKHQAL